MKSHIKYIQGYAKDRQSHFWFGGAVAEIRYEGYKFRIEAVGDVIAELKDEQGEVISSVKDKSNGGYFENEMLHFITNDTMLYDLIERGNLTFTNNNWFEVFVVDREGVFHDVMWVLDSYLLEDAVEEAKLGMDAFIKEKEKGEKKTSMNYWHFANAFGKNMETRRVMIQGIIYMEIMDYYEPLKQTFDIQKVDSLMSSIVDYGWNTYLNSGHDINPIKIGVAYALAFEDYFDKRLNKKDSDTFTSIFDVKGIFERYYDIAIDV